MILSNKLPMQQIITWNLQSKCITVLVYYIDWKSNYNII